MNDWDYNDIEYRALANERQEAPQQYTYAAYNNAPAYMDQREQELRNLIGAFDDPRLKDFLQMRLNKHLMSTYGYIPDDSMRPRMAEMPSYSYAGMRPQQGMVGARTMMEERMAAEEAARQAEIQKQRDYQNYLEWLKNQKKVTNPVDVYGSGYESDHYGENSGVSPYDIVPTQQVEKPKYNQKNNYEQEQPTNYALIDLAHKFGGPATLAGKDALASGRGYNGVRNDSILDRIPDRALIDNSGDLDGARAWVRGVTDVVKQNQLERLAEQENRKKEQQKKLNEAAEKAKAVRDAKKKALGY